MQDSYKALTHVNLPFIGENGEGKRYEPGQMIPLEDIEAYIDLAYERVDDRRDKDSGATPPVTIDGYIEEMIQWGTLSEDPDADLHPSAVIPGVNELSMNNIISSAVALRDRLVSENKEVPPALLSFVAEHEDHQYKNGSGEGPRGVDKDV